ncbi:MAG: DUF2071 domain-containing protein [Cephaloticoccus sp.]|nr:DUF2071 domain-containing protein [Cephaloticoccus sp.]
MTLLTPTEAMRLAERIRPAGRPVMQQQWAQLLFLHWSWDPAVIQRTLPAGLTVDTYEGKAWVGLVPFFMRHVRPAGWPPVPGISNFLELNVRTYVHDAAGRPGVWFYSLDCNQWLAVKVARTFFHLPYEHAKMSARICPEDGAVDYLAQRRGISATAGASRFRYRLAGTTVELEPGTLEFFLLERYRLFAFDQRKSRLLSGQVAHRPYQFGPAVISACDDTMMRLADLDPLGRPAEHTGMAQAVDVDIFPLGLV